jgi:hypothetical protein
MTRYFNTTGPCDPQRHYLIAPERRSRDLLPFVEQGLYFVLHAARQTGKTTAMRALAERLRSLGYAAVWATLEESQGFEEVEQAEPLWLSAIARAASLSLPKEQQPPSIETFRRGSPGSRLNRWLAAWSAQLGDVPLVLLLDEADVVSGPALVSLLRQLRAGFMDRGPGRFPVSVGLIGMRDLRDYLTKAKDDRPVNPGSPFNIKAASITLRNFTHGEVAELLQQHTDDTGQVFEPEAIDRLFEWTQGQPFLVNALARLAVMELCPDPTLPITAATLAQAKEQLIVSRTTHLDALAERLKEPRVARIIQAILLADAPMSIAYEHDDFRYVTDLGLIRRGPDGAEIANPLYREVLARQLSYNVQEALPRPRWRWQRADGGLDMPALIDAFLAWWRENAAIVEQYADRGYLEAVPHLAFMGFLQRVINGGGTIHREFAANRGRIDLLVGYGGERFVIELKRVPAQHRTLERVREEGVEQLLGYLDSLGETQGWLILFDQRAGRTWEERLWREERHLEGKTLHLFGG